MLLFTKRKREGKIAEAGHKRFLKNHTSKIWD